MRKSLFIIALLTLTLILGCTHGVDKKKILEQGPFVQPYETVWVNPQIVYSDSLITLIKAERLDSILVDEPVAESPHDISTFSFHINLGSCLTTMTLKYSNSTSAEIYRDDLPQGYYKFTVNADRLDLEVSKQLPSLHHLTPVYVETSYCGNLLVNKILE